MSLTRSRTLLALAALALASGCVFVRDWLNWFPTKGNGEVHVPLRVESVSAVQCVGGTAGSFSCAADCAIAVSATAASITAVRCELDGSSFVATGSRPFLGPTAYVVGVAWTATGCNPGIQFLGVAATLDDNAGIVVIEGMPAEYDDSAAPAFSCN